ncbi:DUF262 domain-containing protein [Planococcus shenhongbingii]|uniref:DUF262 domain-containing HNH endonuclease family protein n=1 Tax=Planococcus shenhongbingii TaxID=3058398 RepID=A0ABT8NGS2_9BACL|nr:DUF262 domain-containing HNH endonuclease family protein [Planococcus sp. N017]MDN7247082.1 DUF262 domain-containing HNH endonuclease family protein [Planococcus sp. N017]
MSELISLDNLFKGKIFRIPDYQRGYAWQEPQLKDFWEDIVNLSEDRSHYTGLLTLKEIEINKLTEKQNEYWLIDDHSYRMYEIVDGQQRMTTVVIFLQSLIEVLMKNNPGKNAENIFISDSLNLSSIINRYLYKVKPTNAEYRTYKFGYSIDNPSEKYLKHRILNQPDGGSIQETFYTLNLRNAKQYFTEQIELLYFNESLEGVKRLFKKLTKKLLFNEFIIKDEFDVFVAFETMNNRGKKLSDLELLKNRLIYLTTLYEAKELDAADRSAIREDINACWKEGYHQLGRNDLHPLNDDDFLKAHWIMYFKYSRKRGNDYIEFLLNEQFSPQKIYKKVPRNVDLELPEEQRTNFEMDDTDPDEDSNNAPVESSDDKVHLEPKEIKAYVQSLQESAVHWFNSHYPHLASELTIDERDALERLNRIGMGYFRPLVMSILKKEQDLHARIEIFNSIERFVFLVFRIGQVRRTYRDSEFYNAAREFDKGETTLEEIKEKLDAAADFLFDYDGTFLQDYFYEVMKKKFSKPYGSGYYGWQGLRYFLYEYELNLLSDSRQKKVHWEDLLKSPQDRISIEHIFPQTPTHTEWVNKFSGISEEDWFYYQGSIGNLVLLSNSINSSLQNDSFGDKKNPKKNSNGEKIRNGYSDGSHSEIEISTLKEWTPETIKLRGMRLLTFMEKRWNIKFESEEVKESLLFLK